MYLLKYLCEVMDDIKVWIRQQGHSVELDAGKESEARGVQK